jgi:hypothetical protein
MAGLESPAQPTSRSRSPQARKAQGDADAYKIATRELQTALDTLTKGRDADALEKEYLDTVRRMAVVQVGSRGRTAMARDDLRHAHASSSRSFLVPSVVPSDQASQAGSRAGGQRGGRAGAHGARHGAGGGGADVGVVGVAV